MTPRVGSQCKEGIARHGEGAARYKEYNVKRGSSARESTIGDEGTGEGNLIVLKKILANCAPMAIIDYF